MIAINTMAEIDASLAKIYIDKYMADRGNFIKVLCNVILPRKILINTYHKFVQQSVFCKLEELPVPEKQAYFDLYKAASVPLSKEEVTDVCRIIYTLDYIVKNI